MRDRDLKPNAGSKEDAYQPVEKQFCASRERGVDAINLRKRQTGEKSCSKRDQMAGVSNKISPFSLACDG